MPVPFSQEVTTFAAGLLARATDDPAGGDPFHALTTRFPELHPVLIAENLQWTEQLFRAASGVASSVRAGLLTRDQALDALQSSHRSFSPHVVAQALAHASHAAESVPQPPTC